MTSSITLKIIIWNSNGLIQHALELKKFIYDNMIDIALISETHMTSKSFFKMKNYTIYNTNHPDDKAHGGSAIIINDKIKCIVLEDLRLTHLQSTTIQINDQYGPITISSLYCPPKYNLTSTQYDKYIHTLGSRFIAGGDFNAKHTDWGSRLTNLKGKTLLNSILTNNCKFISTGEPTYWPSDPKKKPDLIDFCIFKNISRDKLQIKSCLELSSDHSPILLQYNSIITLKEAPVHLYNKKTNWGNYREYIEKTLHTQISLKTPDELENAIILFNDTLTEAAISSTPILKNSKQQNLQSSIYITNKIKNKRKLRKRWQTTKSPEDKHNLNKAIKELKHILNDEHNKNINSYLSNLSATPSSNYSLWKATKSIKHQIIHSPALKMTNGNWARKDEEKALVLSEHYENTFSIKINDDKIIKASNFPLYDTSIKKITTKEIYNYFNLKLNCNKSPGYDELTGKMIKELPLNGVIYLRNLFNAVIKLKYFPKLWKVAQIIPIQKPGKDGTKAESYRPISLLPVVSKIFETLLYDRIEPVLQQTKAIPDHQFGFRRKHSTIQQIHRVTNKITTDFDKKRFCVAIFLDVAKAFDKVWHDGLLFKLRSFLPDGLYQIIESYLTERSFFVKCQNERSSIRQINAGVPQGSVLGPLLYLLYTADIPKPSEPNALIATFADDTILLASHKNINIATNNLQSIINKTIDWFNTWNIQINENKTVHVIFTTKTKYDVVPLIINNSIIKNDTYAKYLGIIFDNKLTWKHHLTIKRNQIKDKFRQLYWLLNKNSKLTMNNKLLIYKTIIKPIWTYGLQIWGTASKTNIKIIQRQQSKILRTIVNAEWYVTNDNLHKDLGIKAVSEEIKATCTKYNYLLLNHENPEINTLPEQESRPRRLKRCKPGDLMTRF